MTGIAQSAISLNSPTSEWYSIQYANQSDFVNDSRTGIVEADLVGSSVGQPSQSAFYFRYDSAADQIGFRVRIQSDSNPVGFTGAVWVGFLFDAGDSVDLFTGYINKGPTTELGYYDAGTGANTSPSSTTINTTALFAQAVTGSNYLWTPVVVGPSGNDTVTGGTNDVGADGNVDYFMTWVLPFSQLQAAAATQGFTGPTAITASSQFRFVLGTSENANNINQDINGTSGNTTSTSTFSTLGALSPIVTTSGGVLIPEPSSALLVAIAPLLWVLRRRRLR
jgi:hypothetical protein